MIRDLTMCRLLATIWPEVRTRRSWSDDGKGRALRYEIIFAPQAEEDLLALRVKDRSEVLDAIETHLRYEPKKTSKSRIKRLEGLDWPQYRLRIGDIRAFYDVSDSHEDGMVEVLVIREKNEAMKWLVAHGRQTE